MIRKLAYDTLSRIEDDDAYSQIALNKVIENADLEARDKALLTAIVYGCLTWRRALDLIIASASKRKLADIESSTLRVLRIGVYQLHFLDRVPDHAAINESVELSKTLNKKASGFVNAILRKTSKNKDHKWWKEQDKQKKPVRYLADKYSLPNWLANRLIQQQKLENAETIAEGFSKIATTYIRSRVKDCQIGVPVEHFPDARRIQSVDTQVRENILANNIVVQDLGAQKIALLCGDVKGKNVLDACAGMGGKSIYLHDRGANITALEPHEKRLEKLKNTLPEVECVVATLEAFSKTKRQFDVILVDAPCSALGVIRRHPETKWTRKESDISRLEKIQKTLLDNALPLLCEGGTLVYAVCTFTREETTKQIETFLERHPDFSLEVQTQLWPHLDDCDAFFMAKLTQKKPSSAA